MTDGPILCFGEVLWDCLPAGLFLGGAPVNVAYHLHRQGSYALPVTAVGDDFLGLEIQRRLDGWGLPLEGVSLVPELPSGVVVAELDDEGNASYDIRENVAWDQISLTPAVLEKAPEAQALIFGSLAQRSQGNQESLLQLMDATPDVLKVFDVNLRPPFDDLDRVRSLLAKSDVVKVNHEEAARLGHHPETEYETNARALSEEISGIEVCVTAGNDGAGYLQAGEWFWESAKSVEVVDTVGAGDSFVATLISGKLREGRVSSDILARACRVAEWVTAQHGAQPDYSTAPAS